MPPKTDEAKAWYGAVYAAVQQIPYGKVTSYAHIAYLVGYREYLHNNQLTMAFETDDYDQLIVPDPGVDDGDNAQGRAPRFHGGNVPWQRVINSKGLISSRGTGSVARHAAAIRAEGVEVVRGSLGEQSIDFGQYGWFPSALPGEEVSDDEDDEDGE